MRNKIFITEFIISIVLLVLAVLLLNPFKWFMPSSMVMTIIVGLAVAFILFSTFIWKEKARDERELLHRTASGRIAFLSGVLVLVIGVIVEGLKHEVDIWLVLALTVMIMAKVITSIYNNLNN